VTTASFGESEISCNSTRIGKARVLAFHAAQALYPRLTIDVGITLHDVSGEEHISKQVQTPFVMTNITGELRLKETVDIVAPVSWSGQPAFVRSQKFSHEERIHLGCDLDFRRLEQIERWRDSKPPTFWLQLWPTLMANGERLDFAEVRAFQVSIPREVWLAFYTQVGGGQFDVIEVQFSESEAQRFKLAVNKVQKARSEITDGDYDAAVESCRKAVEAIFRDLPEVESSPSENSPSAIKSFLTERTDEKRATAYVGILSKLKELTNIAVHGFGHKMVYSRAEAQFIVRTTEALLALLGRLSNE
jgi:hypothetical protein